MNIKRKIKGFLNRRNLGGILVSGFAGWLVLSYVIYGSLTAPFMDLQNGFKRLTNRG
jgi:hypothetical protein